MPRGALHRASGAGSRTGEGAWEVWTAAEPGAEPLVVELASPRASLRSRWVAGVRAYLYRPNRAAAAAALGLAALTLVLAAHSRRTT